MKPDRRKSHEVAYDRRHDIAIFIMDNTNITVELRGGSGVIPWKDAKIAYKGDREAEGIRLTKETFGLDLIFYHKRKPIWVSLHPEYPPQRKMKVDRVYIRTKGPNPGTPKDKDVIDYFKNQWAVIGRVKNNETTPFEIQKVPLIKCLDAGYREYREGQPRGGYFFPNNKGRRSTVHFFIGDKAVTPFLTTIKCGNDPFSLMEDGNLQEFFEEMFN